MKEPEIRLDREKGQVQTLLGEEVIGAVTVVPITFDWGQGTLVPMGGIAGVGMDEKFRGRGLAGRMMEKAVEFSRDKGYPVGGVSTGFGNHARRLYTGSGYVHLFSVDRYEKPAAEPEPAPMPDGVDIRPYAPEDEKGIIELWNRSYSMNDYFGAPFKDPLKWIACREELLASDPQSVWVAVRNGTVTGWAEYFYHWFNREHCEILVEQNDDEGDVYRGLLTRLECSLNNAGLKHFTFYASHHQARTIAALKETGCRRSEGYVFCMAVFSLPDLLACLQPLYVKRLQTSGLESWPHILRVDTGEQRAEIGLPGGNRDGCIEVAGSYEMLVRVLCGRSSAWEEYLRGRLRIKGDPDRHAADTLFGQYPWFHPLRERW